MFDGTRNSRNGQEEETVLGPKNNMCEGWKQATRIDLGTKNNMCEGGREKQCSPRMKCRSVETQTVIECKKTMNRYWIVIAILVCHTIGRAVLNTRSACELCRMIKLTDMVNDDPIRKNYVAIKELVARKVNVIEIEMEMITYMNANEISGMMGDVTSMKESDAQFKMATTNTEHGGDAMVKDLLEAMNDTKMAFKKKEVMTEKESIGVASEEGKTVSDDSCTTTRIWRVVRQSDRLRLAARALGDKILGSNIKQEEEKGLFNSAWKSAGLEETEKGLNFTWTGNDLNDIAREDAASVGMNEKHMACEIIEKNKVMIRLRNDHTGHKNGGTGSGTLKPFHSDSGACVDVSKIKTRMSTYGSGMYRDMIHVRLRVGNVSEGTSGT